MKHGSLQETEQSQDIQTTAEKEDHLYNYHDARLQLGLFFLNLEDSIKHGDGERLVRTFKFALLIEFKYKHTKYAYDLLLFFTKILGAYFYVP